MSAESTPGPVSSPESFSRQATQTTESNHSSDASLTQNDTPNNHMVVLRPQPRSKVKVKVFQCTGYDDCNMTFSRSEHLARHIRKHTGERPFVCFCGRSFSRLDNLRQHVYTVHAKEGHVVQSTGTVIPMGSKTRRATFDPLQQQQQQQQQQLPQSAPMVTATSSLPQSQPQPYFQPSSTPDTPMGGTNDSGQKPLPPHPVMVMPMASPITVSDPSLHYHSSQQTTAGGVPVMMMMGGTMIGQPTLQQPVPAPGYKYATIPGQGLVQVPIQVPVGGQPQTQPQVYFQNQPPVAPSHGSYPVWTPTTNNGAQLPQSRPQSIDALSAYSLGSNAPPASPVSTSSAVDAASPLRVPSSFSNRQSGDRYNVSSIESSGRLSVASGSSVRSSQTSLWLSSVLNDSNESPPTVSPQSFEPDFSSSLPAVSQLGPLKSSTHRTDLLTKPLPKLPFEISNGSNS